MKWRKRKQEREQRGSNWLDQCRRRHSWWENMDVVFSSVMCRRFWGCYCGCCWNPEINTDVREKKFLVKEQYSTCFFRSIVNRQLVWNCCDTWKVCPFSITDNGLDVSQVIQIKCHEERLWILNSPTLGSDNYSTNLNKLTLLFPIT